MDSSPREHPANHLLVAPPAELVHVFTVGGCRACCPGTAAKPTTAKI